MAAVIAALFLLALLGLVTGGMLFLSNERARRDRTDMRFRSPARRE